MSSKSKQEKMTLFKMIYATCNADMSQEKLETRAKFKWCEKGCRQYLGSICKKQHEG